MARHSTPILLSRVRTVGALLAAAAVTSLAPVSLAQPSDPAEQSDEERRAERQRARDEAEQRAAERRAEIMRQARERIEGDSGDQPDETDDEPNDPARPVGNITFDAFAEGLELRTLVDYVAEKLEINVIIRGNLDGSVVFNARQEVSEDKLYVFLEALLDQFDYAISLEPDTGFYIVAPAAELASSVDREAGTTRIIPTPSVRPSSLQPALSTIFGGGAGARAPAGGVTANGVSITPLDDLGVILASGPPRRLREVESLISLLLEEYGKLEFFKIELEHVAAPAARERLVELVSRTASGPNRSGRAVNPEAANIALVGSSLDNLAERLTADPSSNALIFRGVEEEAAVVRQLIFDIDRPTLLIPRKYFAGSAARQIADIASQRGLGEVITLDSGSGNQFQNDFQRAQLQRGIGGQTTAQVSGGSAMVVDEQNGSIIYYGTGAQQQQLATLIEQLDTDAEIVVIKEYRLQHADAIEVADLLNALINNQQQLREEPSLLAGGRQRNQRLPAERILQDPAQQDQVARAAEGGGIALTASEDTFVIADEANNQILVKAPMRVQEDFGRLIGKIDLRRAQVYVEATIVTVSNTESSRLAIEGAIINQSGDPVIQTLFGLTSADSDGILSARTVNPSLPGLTTAVINSDFVPFVLTAIQTDTDARIISTPQLLVNDNEEASVSSTQSEPTTTTQVGETSDITSFGGFEDATTSLTVTPSISQGGQLILEYEITLEDFVGSGADGIPPPRVSQELNGSVTLPDNTTVVVGGITTSDLTNTVDKVPILGDLPLLGALFRDSSRTEVESLLYVFITPRIMRDPSFRDLRLITRGPQATSEIDRDFPELSPITIPVLDINTRTDLGTGQTSLQPRVEETLPPPASWPTIEPDRAPIVPLDPPPSAPANDNPWIELPEQPAPSGQTNLPPAYREPNR